MYCFNLVDNCKVAHFCIVAWPFSYNDGYILITHVCTQQRVEWLLSISTFVSLFACGHKNEQFEQIRNACSFFLNWIKILIHTSQIGVVQRCEEQFFCWRSVWIIQPIIEGQWGGIPSFQYFLPFFYNRSNNVSTVIPRKSIVCIEHFCNSIQLSTSCLSVSV